MSALRPEAIDSMLSMLRNYQQQTLVVPSPPPTVEGLGPVQGNFAQAIRAAVDEVNLKQLEALHLRESFERGESVPLTDVVIAMQKSSLAFEATLQVRNKVMKAYEDIMNMPV